MMIRKPRQLHSCAMLQWQAENLKVLRTLVFSYYNDRASKGWPTMDTLGQPCHMKMTSMGQVENDPTWIIQQISHHWTISQQKMTNITFMMTIIMNHFMMMMRWSSMKRVALGRQQEHKSILQNPVRATVNAGEITGVGTTKDKTSLELDVKYCSCTRTYYLCPRKPQSFTHLHKNVNREIDYT